MAVAISPKPQTELKPQITLSRNKKVFYGLLIIVAFSMIGGSVVLALPHLIQSGGQAVQYLNLKWAYDQILISQLIVSGTMLWILSSAIFWGSWLLRRTIRKFKGQSWRVLDAKNNKKRFFPPVMRYLQASCFYLMALFLFVVTQYPLQYIIFAP